MVETTAHAANFIGHDAHLDPVVESWVETLRNEFRQNHFELLATKAQDALNEGIFDRRIKYYRALALRQLGKVDEAINALVDLSAAEPRYSRSYQELGHCYVAKRDANAAIAHYRKAVELNPALPSVWDQLAGLYKLTNQLSLSKEAAQQAYAIRQMPEPIVTASAVFADGDLKLAERMVRDYILSQGEHFEAMRLLARIGAALEVYEDAEILLREVIKRVPDYHAARQDLACVLLDRHKYTDAKKELDQLLKIFPNNKHYQTLLASAVVGLGQHQEAIALYKEIIDRETKEPKARAEIELSIAHSYKTIGQTEAAIEYYKKAIASREDFGDAFWSLANLKTYQFTGDEINSMVAKTSLSNTSLEDRVNLEFALAKAFEDRKQYSDAWNHYVKGNHLKRNESRYRPELIELNTANQKSTCSPEFFATRKNYGSPASTPIFILGLPRSGSTLLEQILASHSQVEGTLELADIPRMALELQGHHPDLSNPRYPKVLTDLPSEFFLEKANQYLQDTEVYRSGRAHFIDKMPNNFRHIGLIHLLFPNAPIIDARREPMACCFGNFKQLFARGQEFTYSIEDIARYYRTYLELMEHWDQALPNRVLRVHHEDVVNDLEGSVRRILNYCGLEFEASCLEFYKTERSVRTASSEQVRKPIYREGMDQWRHFEPWLGPLKEQLGNALTRYRLQSNP